MRKLWRQFGDVRAIQAEWRRGRYTVLDFLVALHERADRSVFNAAVTLIRQRQRDSRIQGLAILREMGNPPRPLFRETWDLLERLVDEEKDPVVLSWALGCLGWTRQKRALPTLLRFAEHPDADVRSCIADNLLGCAPSARNRAARRALLRLCADTSRRVGWGALWEIKEHVTDVTPEIGAMLERRRVDSSPRVRELAEEAIQTRRRQSALGKGQLTKRSSGQAPRAGERQR